MNILILSYLKQRGSPFADAERSYIRQMGKGFPLAIQAIRGRMPAGLLRKLLQPDVYRVMLAIKGTPLSTEAFYGKYRDLEKRYRSVVFYIGDEKGQFADQAPPAHFSLSLSPMVFNHFLARLLLLEQLFRIRCIKENHPYHC